jgi:hypothetical protein
MKAIEQIKKRFKRKDPEEEYVIVGFINDGREPWYAKKSDVERWNAEKMEDVI